MKKPLRRKLRTMRIYYGPDEAPTSLWWTVKVTNATKAVKLTGKAIHALASWRGKPMACTMFYCITDEENKSQFPHPMLFAAVFRSTILIVTKLTHGKPSHAVRYAHSVSKIVEMNDKGDIKRIVEQDPSVMQKVFTLRPPQALRNTPRSGPTNEDRSNVGRKAFVHRGNLRRMVDAGLIPPTVAKQIEKAAGQAASKAA